jgi:hypothetical protein
MTMFVLAHITGTGWDDWAIVLGPVLVFAAIAALLMRPRRGERSPLEAAANGLERMTRLPGWAAGTFGTASGGLVLAMLGFYWDVAWHIDQGRDKELFTPPHLLILLGLASILLASGVAIALASATRLDTRLRFRSLRIPWSAVALGVIGGGAVMGFPLDDMWHRAYGIDVTMWGPTHLIMIGGASVATVAMWLVLAEAKVRPVRGTVGFHVHSIAAAGALTGLSALQGEFDFGVPQFQLLYHPVLVMAAAGVVLTAARMALGRGGALRAAVGFIALRGLVALFVAGFGYTAPHFPLYLAPAIAVEVVALLIGTERLGRFALAAGLGIASFGLAGEWAWTHAWARHPWTSSLLPEAVWVGVIAALGAALLGAALGAIVSGRAVETQPLVSRRTIAFGLIGATLALGTALAFPIKRTPSDVIATMKIQPVGGLAFVELTLSPPAAAAQAHWFEAMAWQGGDLVISKLERVGPGRYRTATPVPIGGKAKALVRLARGAEMSAVPIRFPADPEIGAPAIPAVDRVARFERDTKLLMREAHVGNPLTARIVFATLAAIVVAWLIVLTLTGWGIVTGSPKPDRVDAEASKAA